MVDEIVSRRGGLRWWWWLLAALIGLVLMVVALPDPQPPEPEPSEAELRALISIPGVVADGRSLYAQYCGACHGRIGEGAQGPNLRDDFWIKGSDMAQIARSIADGNLARGMVAWKGYLKRAQIHALAAYIASLHGSEDGSGKTAEGGRAPIAYWPAPTPSPAPGPAAPLPPAPAR
jgi:mono/diheme cytochrome c family protein